MNTTSPELPMYLRVNYEALEDRTKSSLDRLSALTSVRANLENAAFQLAIDARNAGASWQEIGMRLGISKQAAHKRFGMGVEQIVNVWLIPGNGVGEVTLIRELDVPNV